MLQPQSIYSLLVMLHSNQSCHLISWYIISVFGLFGHFLELYIDIRDKIQNIYSLQVLSKYKAYYLEMKNSINTTNFTSIFYFRNYPMGLTVSDKKNGISMWKW